MMKQTQASKRAYNGQNINFDLKKAGSFNINY